MNQPMNICPLLAIASIGTSSGPAVCVEGRCAWWGTWVGPADLTYGQCALQSIAESLSSLDSNGLSVIS